MLKRRPRSYASLALFFLTLTTVSPADCENLQEAWEIALSVDHRLQATHNTIESADETLSAAKSQRLPGVSAEGGYTALDRTPAISLQLPGIPVTDLPLADDNKFFASKVMVSMPLFTSGRINHGIEAAHFSVDAAKADEARTILDLKMNVAEAYVSVLRATHLLQVAQSNVKSLESHGRDVENLYEKGFVSKSDLLAVRVALADARQMELQVENKLDIARAAYNRLLGRPFTALSKLDEIALQPMASNLDSLTAEALEHRPELHGLAQQAQALEHQAASIRAAALPQVAVTGGYAFLENRFLANEETWLVSLGVKWDIFDGGVKSHEARSILRKKGAVQELQEDVKSAIALQVRQAWLDVEETRKRLEVTRKAIDQAEENLKVANDRYRTGLGTNTEVLDAETLRTRSHNNHDNALYDAVLADLHLRCAVGSL